MHLNYLLRAQTKKQDDFGEWQSRKTIKQVDVIEKVYGGEEAEVVAVCLDTRMESGFLEEGTFELRPEGEGASHERVGGKFSKQRKLLL